MSCQTFPCWSRKAELSGESKKEVNDSNVITAGDLVSGASE
jgi:hypothetical protein